MAVWVVHPWRLALAQVVQFHNRAELDDAEVVVDDKAVDVVVVVVVAVSELGYKDDYLLSSSD